MQVLKYPKENQLFQCFLKKEMYSTCLLELKDILYRLNVNITSQENSTGLAYCLWEEK